MREQFGWSYGSYWRLDAAERALCFASELGQVSEDFRRVTTSASFAKGVGLSGRAWLERDLVFVPDLGQVADCVRAPAAQRAGVRSGICFPLMQDGRVTGTLDFFALERIELSPQRRQALQCIGVLVSQSLERLAAAQRQSDAAEDVAAVNAVLREISTAPSVDRALGQALETIRTGFGWAYGSYWRVDASDASTRPVLRFVQESGDAGQEFRDVTTAASFAEGVGLAGRAWQTRDLVFVPDLAEVTDCVRAPAARRAGVRSGVCLPILVGGEVVGTMDFFATTSVTLSSGRQDALRNTAFLVGQALERSAATHRLSSAGEQMVSSIGEVQRNVAAAAAVADDGRRLALEANRQVAGLGRSSAQISAVVHDISRIAA